jgi:hypothetical protein
MKRTHPSDSAPASAGPLKGSLDGPSKTITVEPIQMPIPAPPRRVDAPDPERERQREPEQPSEPAR